MSPSITIRPLSGTDEIAWRDLWSGYLDFYETSVSAEVYETALPRLLAEDRSEFQGVIAEVGGVPFGLAHFLFHRFLWNVEDTRYLMDLFVVPTQRGIGVGRALIEHIRSCARDAGIPSLYLMTQETNVAGCRLYDQIAVKTPFIVYEMHD